jgi:hypothetical protein
VLRGCTGTGAKIAQVVCVRTINDMLETVRLGDTGEQAEQLTFAVVAAIGRVGDEIGIREFVGFDLDEVETELLGKGPSLVYFVVRIGVRGS